uniref:Uncharacterized protein n=1 Tax=Rhizophora mucronata TaxID=61149 RepID=A0A2P2N450_RHIMU
MVANLSINLSSDKGYLVIFSVSYGMLSISCQAIGGALMRELKEVFGKNIFCLF